MFVELNEFFLPCIQGFHKGLYDLFFLLSLRSTFQRASVLATAFSAHRCDLFARRWVPVAPQCLRRGVQRVRQRVIRSEVDDGVAFRDGGLQQQDPRSKGLRES